MLEQPSNLGNPRVGSEVNAKSRGKQPVVMPIKRLARSDAGRTLCGDAQIGVAENMANRVHMHPAPEKSSTKNLL